MSVKSPVPALPAPFARALDDLMGARWRPDVEVEEIPAPTRIAPHSVAISADVVALGDEVGNGRLILLYDPQGNPSWDGSFRCVTFARAEVTPDMAGDALLPEVGWSWLLDALDTHHAAYTAAAGTVTTVVSRTFGDMEDDPGHDEVELRASWTPLLESDGAGINAHLAAWEELLCMVAGLPPLPPGVTALPTALRARS